MGDGEVDHHRREATSVGDFPEVRRADVTAIDEAFLVALALTREEVEHAVFAGVSSARERGPRTRCPRWMGTL
jgi:hypothetical protein